MKKIFKFIFGGIAVILIAGFAMFNVSLNSQNELSAIVKANIEALATENPLSGFVFCSRQGDSNNQCNYSNSGTNWGVCISLSSPSRYECINSSTHDCNGTFSCP